jgi:hypothetical protein
MAMSIPVPWSLLQSIERIQQAKTVFIIAGYLYENLFSKWSKDEGALDSLPCEFQPRSLDQATAQGSWTGTHAAYSHLYR